MLDCGQACNPKETLRAELPAQREVDARLQVQRLKTEKTLL
jgi:hypothetical protein